jgi:hypothetical protein
MRLRIVGGDRSIFAWQGWRTELPRGWNPVRLEGSYDTGSAMIADLDRPRMLVRWIDRKLDVSYENDAQAGGVKILDQPADRAMLWSVFDLSCIAPAGMKLKSQRLLAGDLSLTFADRANLLTVRQIALARLALSRMNLDRWLADQQRLSAKHYRATGPVCDTEIESCDGARWPARTRRMTKLARFFFLRALPHELVTMAAHDEERDRLVILESNDDALARKMAQTVGTSAKEASYAVASEA